jgi:enoyl-CoA hydratase/carnithine racemase
MERESEWIADMARTWDAQEGIAAFIGKRAPKFNGQ